MLRLEIFIILLVATNSQDLLGVNYSFDVDFYRNFDSRKCDNESVWRVVRYEALDINPPSMDSDKGIQAVGKSCATSFPIIFFGGTLEFNVYVQLFTQRYRLSIEVFDEEDVPITRYAYGRLSDGFASGWMILSLKINKQAKGYIKIRGRSRSNETILIDSFRYIPNSTASYDNKQNPNHDREDEDIIFKYKDLRSEAEDGSNDLFDYDDDGSGEPTTIAPPDLEKPSQPGRSPVWNPFTIFLVSFGVVMAAAFTGVGAYYFGKVKARENLPDIIFEEDIERPTSITIPRAVVAPDNRLDFMRINYT